MVYNAHSCAMSLSASEHLFEAMYYSHFSGEETKPQSSPNLELLDLGLKFTSDPGPSPPF